MLLFDDAFQMIIEVHQEMTELKEDNSGEKWLSELDEKAFTFKQKVSNWLKDALETTSKNK